MDDVPVDAMCYAQYRDLDGGYLPNIDYFFG
jgi:hypothetical protein